MQASTFPWQKCLFCGDAAGVGKSSLLLRFADGIFVHNYLCTLTFKNRKQLNVSHSNHSNGIQPEVSCVCRYHWSGFPNPTFDIGWDETWIVKCQSFIFSVSMGQRAMVFGHISSLCTRGLSNCMCGTWLDSCAMVSAIHPSGPFEASTCERCVIYCNLRDFVCIFKNRCPVGLNFDTCQLLMVCQQN